MSSNQSLRKLSDNALLSRLHKLVKQEKQTTLSILVHLAEVDRRDLYLAYGFSSLFDYCVGALGYSRSAAGRRIASARCLRRYPEVFDLLESGDVNLCTVGLVAPILDDANKDLLFGEIRGKTQQQVESIVSRYKPPTAYRDRVRPVRVAVPELGQNSNNRRNPLIFNSRCGSGDQRNCGIVDPGGHEGASAGNAGGSLGSSLRLFDAEGTRGGSHASGATGNTGQGNGGNGQENSRRCVRIEKRLLIQFLADEEFIAKLEKVKSLLSNKIPDGSFEDVFEAVMDEFIDRHSPKKREERREKRHGRKTRRQQGTDEPMEVEPAQHVARGNRRQDPRARYIPVKTRDAVHNRDGGKCTYVGSNGKRCDSTHNLQIDHIKPFARGGTNTLSNLRLLCGKHNRYEAKRMLGTSVMKRHVAIE